MPAKHTIRLPEHQLQLLPGIVLSTEVFESGYTAERATIAKTYETILDDLKTALDNLPETSKVVTAGHIDYWGARALRARAYLYMNENSKALEDAKTLFILARER